ncbi:DUF6192 family protein [Nonomuraea rosea]|uniref:DUF6192 family protein n=1 Tax=Nonomuraea rosea TaxID=638574 RepID=UPI0031ECC4B0
MSHHVLELIGFGKPGHGLVVGVPVAREGGRVAEMTEPPPAERGSDVGLSLVVRIPPLSRTSREGERTMPAMIGHVTQERYDQLVEQQTRRNFSWATSPWKSSLRALPAVPRPHPSSQLTGDERTAVKRNVARVRATADWLEAAIASDDVSLDEGLARLLRGEQTMPPEMPLLLVDLGVERGRQMRVIATELYSIEANLSIGNMDFAEFANAMDGDGIFRGF